MNKRSPKSVLKNVARHTRAAGARLKNLNTRMQKAAAPHLSVSEQMFLFKRLAFLSRAGVPLLESLHMLKEQTVSYQHARITESVINDISNGSSLAKSLGRFPGIFGDFGINILKVGESSGTLSENLEYLADELQKRKAIQGKVIGAFIYPAIITLATLGITGFLVLYLFPKIMPVFASLHMELPLTTRIVIGLSTFLQNWGILLIFFIIGISIAGFFALKQNPRLRFMRDSLMLRLPLLGSLFRSYVLANTTRTLGLLLKSGLTLSEALPLVADTTQNLLYKQKYRELAEAINRGERVSTFLRQDTHLFPAVMTQMVAVGERSGSLSRTLVYISELYETEVDDFTKNLSTIMEPALMVVMGIIVGFIAISIITPIYGITQNLHN